MNFGFGPIGFASFSGPDLNLIFLLLAGLKAPLLNPNRAVGSVELGGDLVDGVGLGDGVELERGFGRTIRWR